MPDRTDVNDCLRLVGELFNKHQTYHPPAIIPANYQIVFHENKNMALLAENNSIRPIAASFGPELFNILRNLARQGPGVVKRYKGVMYFFQRDEVSMAFTT